MNFRGTIVDRTRRTPVTRDHWSLIADLGGPISAGWNSTAAAMVQTSANAIS